MSCTAVAFLLLLTGQANSQSTREVIGPIPKPVVVQVQPNVAWSLPRLEASLHTGLRCFVCHADQPRRAWCV